MPPATAAPARDLELSSKGHSRGGAVFCLRTIALLLALIAIDFGGLTNIALMRILAGSPTPWAQRIDFTGGNWGFTPFTSVHIAGSALIAAAALLFFLAAKSLRKRKRSALYLAYALLGILLILSTIIFLSKIWYAYSLLANESGSAFGKPEPQWADIPLPLPALLLLLEIFALTTLRLLTKLRIDLLH